MSLSRGALCPWLSGWLLGLMVAVPVWAAGPQRDKANWDNLKELVSGQEIQVVLNDAKSYRGKFQSVSDEGLVVSLATDEQTFTKQSVLRVSSKGQGRRGRNIGIGALIGVGGGAATGAAINPISLTTRGETVAIGMVIGAVAGAVVGAALPTGGWQEVYRAR